MQELQFSLTISESKLKVYCTGSQLYFEFMFNYRKVPRSQIHSQYFYLFLIPVVLRKYMFQNLVLCMDYLPVNEFINVPVC